MRRSLEIAALVAAAAFALFLRADEYAERRERFEPAFHRGEPLLLNLDGYYHLRLARECLEGAYAPKDELRRYPDGARRPSPPSPMVLGVAAAARACSSPVERAGAWFPVFVALLIPVVVYGVSRTLAGSTAGIAAAFFAASSEYLLYRTSVGWLDTDGGNLVLLLASVFFFLRFAMIEGGRRYAHFAGGAASAGLLLWWWQGAPDAAIAAASPAPVLALLLFYRPARREGILFGFVLALLAAGLLVAGGAAAAADIVRAMAGRMAQLGGGAGGALPNVSASIVELRPVPIGEAAARTAGHPAIFVATLAGLLLLFFRRPKETLILAAPIALGLIPFIAGSRFLIFTAPIAAIGAGELVRRTAAVFRPDRKRAALAVAATAAVLVLPVAAKSLGAAYRPVLTSPVVRGMEAAGKTAPPGAPIWCWWDDGYALQYWARRPTVTDGGAFDEGRAYRCAVPLAVSDPEFSLRAMRFTLDRGAAGDAAIVRAAEGDTVRALRSARRVFSEGPRAARELFTGPIVFRGEMTDPADFFFPRGGEPFALFLTSDLVRKAGAWYHFGTWDPIRQEGDAVLCREFTSVRRADEETIVDESLFVSTKDGSINVVDEEGVEHRRTLARLVIHDGGTMDERSFTSDSGWRFDFFPERRYGVLASAGVARSLVYRLLVGDERDLPGFRLAERRFLFYGIWLAGNEVDPERRGED